MTRLRSLGSILLWLGVVTGAIVFLQDLGQGSLSTPPIHDKAAAHDWLAAHGAVGAALALLRLVALAAAWYLLAVTVLGLAARASRVPGMVRTADRATVPLVRRILSGVAGIGLSASTTTMLVTLPVAPPAAAVTSLAGEPAEADDDGGGSTAIMRVVTPAPAAVPDPAPTPTTWRVEQGQHLWGLTESVLATTWGRAPSDGEVTPFWQAVIEANRGVLADPDNPDLVFSGQVFVIPTPPPAP